MEYLRSIKITVEIDTNKATYEEKFELQEGEGVDDLMERVKEYVETYTDYS